MVDCMSAWGHNICMKCWKRREPGRAPVRFTEADLERCCFCGDMTQDGIYTRLNPNDDALQCGGEHPDEMVAG